MRVKTVDDNLIEFDNGNRISTVGDDDGYGEVVVAQRMKQRFGITGD